MLPSNPQNAVFNYPQWSVPAEAQASLLMTASVLAALSLVYACWLAWRRRAIWPLIVFVGAGYGVIYEPLGDILTKVAYPPIDQVSLMTAFGRPTPLWMLPNYFFFFCVPVLLLCQFLMRPGVSARAWWLTYLGVALFVAVFEQPGINGDMWRYYAANQAFSINTYPVWVAFANSCSLLVMAAGVHLLRRNVLPPAATPALVLILPILFVGSHIGTTVAVASALYTTDNVTIVNLAALVAIATCLLTVAIAHALVSRDVQPRYPDAGDRKRMTA